MATPTGQVDGGRRLPLRTVVRVLLLARAVVVMALGLVWVISGHNVPLLGNLLATYFLAAGLLTVVWLRAHRGTHGSRLAVAGAGVAIVGGIVVLARLLIERVSSTDVALAVIGIITLGIGTLRIAGGLRDTAKGAPHAQLLRRVVLGVSEVGVGLLFVLAREVNRAVTTSVGLWALLGGTIMLLDAVAVLRDRTTSPDVR